MNNPTKQDLNVYLHWEFPDRRWEVSPARGTMVFLKSGMQNQPVEFFLKRSDASRPEGWPECLIKIPYLTSRGEWVTVEHRVEIKDDSPMFD
jgi:hypothetical protein